MSLHMVELTLICVQYINLEILYPKNKFIQMATFGNSCNLHTSKMSTSSLSRGFSILEQAFCMCCKSDVYMCKYICFVVSVMLNMTGIETRGHRETMGETIISND